MTTILALGTLTALAAQGLAGTATVSGVVRLTNQSVHNAVVLLVPLDSAFLPLQPETVLIDQRDLRFVPRVVVVEPHSSIRFANSDPLLHNVFSPPSVGTGFDLGTYPIGESRLRAFDASGVHVILCHIHPDMVAYVVVSRTRYRAVLDEDGAFELSRLPAGGYVLRVLRGRRVHYQQSVSLRAGQELRLRFEPQSASRRR